MTRPQLKTESEVLDTLTLLTRQLGMPPTIREIQQYLGVGSTRTVLRYLKKLETEGRIKRWKGARGMKISARQPEQGAQPTPPEGELISREAAIGILGYFKPPHVPGEPERPLTQTIDAMIAELRALPAAPTDEQENIRALLNIKNELWENAEKECDELREALRETVERWHGSAAHKGEFQDCDTAYCVRARKLIETNLSQSAASARQRTPPFSPNPRLS